MNRMPYTTDGEYTLYLLVDILDSGNKMYSIFDSDNDYCGGIELFDPASDIPEIGIDIMEEKRNQGIAAKAVKMLVQKVCQERKVEYFLIRISAENAHSQHVFEKMGAIRIGEEVTDLLKKAVSCFNHIGENLSDFELKILQEGLEGKNTETIYRYKLLPDVFE